MLQTSSTLETVVQNIVGIINIYPYTPSSRVLTPIKGTLFAIGSSRGKESKEQEVVV